MDGAFPRVWRAANQGTIKQAAGSAPHSANKAHPLRGRRLDPTDRGGDQFDAKGQQYAVQWN